MTALWPRLRGEPVASMAVITAILGIATITGIADEKLTGAIAILVGAILAFPIRGIVTPVATAVATVKAAAQDAAATTAESVNSHTAGPVGATTDESRAIVNEAASQAADTALKAIGVTRRQRAA